MAALDLAHRALSISERGGAVLAHDRSAVYVAGLAAAALVWAGALVRVRSASIAIAGGVVPGGATVRLALPGVAEGIACEGCPPLPRLFEQFTQGGGELLTCPICFNTKKLDEAELVPNAKLAGATPLWEWVGEGATVFSY